MKVRYVGISFGVDSLTDGKIYECVGINYHLLGLQMILEKIIYILHQFQVI